MKKKIGIIFFTAFTFLTAAPLITVEDVKDFGPVKESNTTLEHTFIITNSGTDTLRIQKVKPG
jgi:hypothetical protein